MRVSATDRATGKNVAAILESPYRLNPAQLKVLQRKVEREIGVIRDAEVRRRELEAQAGAKSDAQRLSDSIGRFLDQFGNYLPSDSSSLLASGRAVVGEYVSANASAADMSVLIGSLRSAFEDAVLRQVFVRLRSITESEAFTRWQLHALGTRTKVDCLSAINEFTHVCEAQLEEIASLLQITETHISSERILACRTPSTGPGTIFILTQFFGFKPDAMYLDVMREGNRGLLRILLLAQLARDSRSHFGPVAAQALRNEFIGTSCLFLLDYLSAGTDRDIRAAVEECVRRVPAGTWRKAWQECEYAPKFVDENSIGRSEVVREIVEALQATDNPELQVVALNDLQKIGIENCMPTIFNVICLALDVRVKLVLLDLLRHCPRPEVIPVLLQAVVDERSDVSKAAIRALREREFEVPKELVSLLRIAEKVVGDHAKLTFTERITLWRVARSHSDLRALAQFLQKQNHTSVPSPQ